MKTNEWKSEELFIEEIILTDEEKKELVGGYADILIPQSVASLVNAPGKGTGSLYCQCSAGIGG
jgi:hypothetical protein